MRYVGIIVACTMLAAQATAQSVASEAQFQDVMGDNYYELPAEASDAERRPYARAVTRGLLTYISTSYNNKKRALDASWAQGEIDSPAREAALAALNESRSSLDTQVRGSGYEDMVLDELLVFARQTIGGTDASFSLTGQSAEPPELNHACHCLKTRNLDELGRGACSRQIEALDDVRMAELPALCRGIQIDDPLADALAACSNYESRFAHELTGESMTRRVTRGTYGCRYDETIPGDFLMACEWTDAEALAEISDYFRYAEFYSDAKISTSTEFVNGQPVTTTTYLVDGQPWHNPMQASMDSGQCKVTRQ